MSQEKYTHNPNQESLSTKAKIAIAAGALAVFSWAGFEISNSPANLYGQEDRGAVEYTVDSGDTLWRIARPIAVVNGLDTREVEDLIAKHNGIEDPGKIQVGEVLELPDYSKEVDEYYDKIDNQQG